MVNRKEVFKVFISEVINSNLSETQRELYSFEGSEIIDNLFDKRKLQSSVVNEDNSYGFSPQALSAIQTSVAFIGVIAAFFKVYIDYLELKRKSAESKLDDLIIYESLEAKLKEHDITPELRKQLADKYSKKLAQIIEAL